VKTVGIVVLVVAALAGVLSFSGLITGKANVEVTDKGRTTYNQGLDHLKLQENPKAKTP